MTVRQRVALLLREGPITYCTISLFFDDGIEFLLDDGRKVKYVWRNILHIGLLG